ncbi:methyltransferase [Jiella endophytica]|uniref:Methyltransferase n=1 Tax=Jiella endophytica TaxID=2558362 RepID=A0A4Y8RH27_9HYPH|nr:methyltransferase [Jiella endophytica]
MPISATRSRRRAEPVTGVPGDPPAEGASERPAVAAPETIDGREVRRDGFYGGRFTVFQPKGWGYRSGLDALLLAACFAPATSGRIVDLGAGSGVVGMAAAERAAEATVTLVEAEPVMASLCRHSLAMAENSALAARLSVAEIDISARRAEREAAGLMDCAFDLVLTNPPFHPANHRRSPDPVRERALSAGMPLERWLAVAAALLAPKGRLVTVLRADLLGGAIAALEPRLGGLAVVPVHTRMGAPAERILIAGTRGSKAPLRLLPGIALGDADGASTPLSREIAAGTAEIAI